MSEESLLNMFIIDNQELNTLKRKRLLLVSFNLNEKEIKRDKYFKIERTLINCTLYYEVIF